MTPASSIAPADEPMQPVATAPPTKGAKGKKRPALKINMNSISNVDTPMQSAAQASPEEAPAAITKVDIRKMPRS